jgi:hypothetical protein
MPKARELPQPFYETHGFTDREDGLIFATLRRISFEDEATLHSQAKVAECRLTVRKGMAYLIRNDVEYFLHPKRLVFEDKNSVSTTATAEQLKDRSVINRMKKAIPVTAQIKSDPLLASVTDEQLEILDQAHSRYRAMVGLGSGDGGIDPAIQAQDCADFPKMIKRGKNGLAVYSDSDCAIFMAKVSGLRRELCSYWMRYDFLREHGVSVEEYASA